MGLVETLCSRGSKERGLNVPMCKVTKQNISESFSHKKAVKLFFHFKHQTETTAHVRFRGCVIR